MNKYSSKAVKTAATVGMSLAMVLGNVAPVINTTMTTFANGETTEPVVTVGPVETAVQNKEKVEKILELLGDVTIIPADATISGSKDYVAGGKDVDFATFLNDSSVRVMLENAYKYADVVRYTEDQETTLKYLVKTTIKHMSAEGEDTKTATDWAAELVAGGILSELKRYNGTITPDDEFAVKLYDKTSALLEFKGNVPSTEQSKVDEIEELFADLESDVKDYKEDRVEVYAKNFANALAKEPVIGTTVEKLIEDKDTIVEYTKLSSIKSFIAKVTKDSYKLADVKYGDVKDEAVVADYIDELQAIADEMQDVKDLLDDTKDEKKAFDKLSKKLSTLAGLVKTDANDDELDKIDDAIADFRTSDINALKEYVDTVVNEFWTVTTVERSSGTYRTKPVNAGFGRYYEFKKVAGSDLQKLMTTLVESDEEETYYDLLVAEAASTDELLKAVTTDIEGITLNSTLTDKEAAKIIAANKALKKIGEKGDSVYDSLTRSEKADVDANRDLIKVMYTKLILNGNITTTGWIDNGNGNWDYINEDGTRSTKWVAAGSDWYYVKNGTMLRNSWIASDAQGTRWYYVDDAGKMVSNTTVNGYTFNSYGVWVK